MKIIIYLRKFARSFLSGRKSIFTFDIELQKEYLKKLGEPIDDVERSFFQYKCQMRLAGTLYKILVNIISPVLILFYIFRYYKKSNAYNIGDSQEANDHNAIFFTNSLSDKYIPGELSGEFHSIINVELTDKCSLGKTDMQFFKMIMKRYPFSWFYLLKNLLKIAVYHEQIVKYNPKAVIVSAEYSFTSATMTAYCQMNGIWHINIQHGEKMFYMRDSYFRFHRFYIWDEYYKDTFIRLKAESTQFIVVKPAVLSELRTKIDHYKGTLKQYDYKYYLAAESKSELLRIKNTLLKLHGERGICLRPHPIYSNIEIVREIFSSNFDIEDTKEMAIEQSLAGCGIALSLHSTVLQQAYYGGVPTAIDDISFPDFYQTLERLEFIMIKRSKKLSEIIKEQYQNEKGD